jgi:hypothetical protein
MRHLSVRLRPPYIFWNSETQRLLLRIFIVVPGRSNALHGRQIAYDMNEQTLLHLRLSSGVLEAGHALHSVSLHQ